MTLDKLTSRTYNNIVSGLKGVSVNTSFTLEQIEDEIIQERMSVIKLYASKNLLPLKDLLYPIRCVPVDCESLDRCPCGTSLLNTTMVKHIELPQTYNDFGEDAIDYIGSTDGLVEYKVYTDDTYKLHKYKRRGADSPYVWIDITPNNNGFYDAFIFNAPAVVTNLLARVIPKDPRQLLAYSCCTGDGVNITFIDTEIEKNVTEKMIRYYRQMALANTPTDETIKV